MTQATQIKFNLLCNARDSLRQAVELLAWQDLGSEPAQLKHAITHTAQAIELLLKERLRRIAPSLVWKNPRHYPDPSKYTVNPEQAIERLAEYGVAITPADIALLSDLREERNTIEHFEWNTTVEKVRAMAGQALSFAFDFAHEALGENLAAGFLYDDTWRAFLAEQPAFERAHAGRIEARLIAKGQFPDYCDECGAPTVSPQSGRCLLCGQ